MRIGVFHHDPVAADALSAILARYGHKPATFASGMALADAAARDPFDLLLMRWDGADLCGVAVMRRLHGGRAGRPAIVLIVTADAPGGIAEGADAVLPDPWDDRWPEAWDETYIPQAIAAAITVRNTIEAADEKLGNLVFDRAACHVTVSGDVVVLTAKEFALALLFVRNIGLALSRQQIMSSVWGRSDDPGSRTIDAHVAQVRKRLALRPEHGWRLSCVYGFGYRLETFSSC